MKKFRIRPDINGTVAVWSLDERKGLTWKRVFRHNEIKIVVGMKDHLLKRSAIYTSKNNVPEEFLRKTPSEWLKPKLKRLKIKRPELPDSLKY